MGNILYYLIAVSVIGMAYSFWKYFQLTQIETGTSSSIEKALVIKNGAIRYIQTEYKILLLFVISIGLLLFFKGQAESDSNGFITTSYVVGAGFSALAGYIGIRLSTLSNNIVSNESRVSFSIAYKSAISGSASIGLANISLMIAGIAGLLLIYNYLGHSWTASMTINILAGFALGASSVSLFSRVGGGLFSKSAEQTDFDIQHTELGIRQNSVHNPASSSCEIGQNITNIGGIGSDLFESFSASIIASMILGVGFLNSESIMDKLPMGPVLVPFAIAAVGILTSIGAIFLLNANNKSGAKNALDLSEGMAAVLMVVAAFFISKFLLPSEWKFSDLGEESIITTTYHSLGIFWCALFGIAASVAIGKLSPLFIGDKTKSIKSVVEQSAKGPESNILAGLQNGSIAIGTSLILIITVSILSYYFAGYYGLGIAAVSMLSNMGYYFTINAFAPIADNSNSIAIKAEMSNEAISNTNELKQTGIPTLANQRSFIIVASSFSVIAIFSAFLQNTGVEMVNLTKPLVISGMLLGSVLPFLLNSTTLGAIRRITKKMTQEVKRQFTEIPTLAEAKEILDKYHGDLTYATEGEKEIVYSSAKDVDHNQFVEISSYQTIWESIIPGVAAISLTTLLGYFAGIEILAGFLVGTISSGIVLSLFISNSGNTWESTKFALENGVEINGEILNESSPAYQSAIIGDKVGKPLKDSISPTIMVIVKLILITAIILSSGLINRLASKKGLHVKNNININYQGQKEKQEIAQNTCQFNAYE